MASITIYTKDYCPFCHRAKALLGRKGVPYQEIDVTHDPAGYAEMCRRSGRDTVPQIFAGDRHVGDCDEIHALEARGELDARLETSQS